MSKLQGCVAIIVMLILLIGCTKNSGTSSEGNTNSYSTKTSTTKARISKDTAILLAKRHLEQSYYNAAHFSYGTITVKTVNVDDYDITLKGTYYQYDSYGQLTGRKKFARTVFVTSDGVCPF